MTASWASYGNQELHKRLTCRAKGPGDVCAGVCSWQYTPQTQKEMPHTHTQTHTRKETKMEKKSFELLKCDIDLQCRFCYSFNVSEKV